MGLADQFVKSSKLKRAGKLSTIVEEPETRYDTGVYALNLAYSGDLLGGTSTGVSLLAGKSRSFKTLFGLISCKSYLDAHDDSYMIFYDSEGGASEEYFESVGIDTGRVLYFSIMNVEELKLDIVTKLEAIKKEYEETGEYPKFIFFIDSIGNLASLKEVEDAINQKTVADMSRAKALKSFFRIVTPYIKNYELQLIAIMHTYDEIGGMGAPKQIMSGGCLLPGTQILTSEGLKNIECINVDDMVVSGDGGLTRVVNAWTPETLENGVPECLEITFEDGHVVRCSESHKFRVNGEWIEAKDLTAGVVTDDV
jgi:RecA/RadA recombinase